MEVSRSAEPGSLALCSRSVRRLLWLLLVSRAFFKFACPNSGASTDIFPFRDCFEDYTPTPSCSYVTMGNGGPCAVLGHVTLVLRLLDDQVTDLRSILHVPDFDVTLLSVR